MCLTHTQESASMLQVSTPGKTIDADAATLLSTKVSGGDCHFNRSRNFENQEYLLYRHSTGKPHTQQVGFPVFYMIGRTKVNVTGCLMLINRSQCSDSDTQARCGRKYSQKSARYYSPHLQNDQVLL